jgi:hypothetical protein
MPDMSYTDVREVPEFRKEKLGSRGLRTYV